MSILRAEIFFAPMPKQDHASRKCVKQSALGHEHRQRNAFPGDVVDVLVIDEFETAQKLKADEAAVEKIDAGRITKMLAINVDWVGWPKMNAVGEEVDVRDVQSEIAQVHRRLNFHFRSVPIEQPNK